MTRYARTTCITEMLIAQPGHDGYSAKKHKYYKSMCIDLHLHSLFSDGTSSPAELVRIAKESGLRAIALTDHDTVEGIDEFLAQDKTSNLELFSGLEISATHRGISMHILGFGIDHHNRELLKWLSLLQEGRESRNQKIIEKLREMGHSIQPGELDLLSQFGQTGRPHIARLLKNKGIVQSTRDAFSLYLRKGGPAFIERFAYSAAETIDMIHRAGGIAVLAHPGILEQQTSGLSLLIAELVERGLDGIEAFYPNHTPAVEKKMCAFAQKYHLVLTGGSDYHGSHRSYSSMAGSGNGFCPPDTLLDPLRQRIQIRLASITNN